MVGLTEAPEELNEGDYICYPADLPHIFKALAPDIPGDFSRGAELNMPACHADTQVIYSLYHYIHAS
jgi:hypothetical protein